MQRGQPEPRLGSELRPALALSSDIFLRRNYVRLRAAAESMECKQTLIPVKAYGLYACGAVACPVQTQVSAVLIYALSHSYFNYFSSCTSFIR